MSKTLEKIKSLIEVLPQKDISYGYKFLEKRDFESLKELVDSAIYKLKKKLKSDEFEGGCLDTQLLQLNELQVEVNSYMSYLDIPEDNQDFEESIYSDEEYIKDIYEL